MKKCITLFFLAITLLFTGMDMTVFATETTTERAGVGTDNTDTNTPTVTAVILSVNQGQLRIRAWSASEGIETVSATINCTKGSSGEVYTLHSDLEMADGYYTSHLSIGNGVTKVHVVVAATNKEGKTGYKAAQIFPEGQELESESVSNDLWVRFLDGEGVKKSEYTYTGKAIKPAVEIYEGAVLLKEKKDYTLSYKNNKNAGSGTIIVKGKGNYKEKAEIAFTIRPKNIGEEEVTVADFSVAHNGKVHKKVPSLTYNKLKLSNKKEKDFSVVYISNQEGAYQNPGIYQVKIVGRNNYTGEKIVDFSVGPKLVKNLKVEKIAPMEYTGEELRPALVIKDGRKEVPAELFTITYQNNIDAGTAAVTIKGNGVDYAGIKKVTFTIKGTNLKGLVTGKEALPGQVTYNGLEQRPQPKLIFEDKPLVEGKDYRIEYKNNLKAGKAAMTITGKGRFTGVIKHSFKILPFDTAQNEGGKFSVTLSGVSGQKELNLPFSKAGVKPMEQVRFDGKLLTKGQDYTVTYSHNKAVTMESTKKRPKVTIKMKGNFSGTFEKEFSIYAQSLENTKITIQDVVPTKKKFSWKPKVVVTDLDGKKLTAGKDYEKIIGYYTDELCLNEASEEAYPVNTVLWVKIKGMGNYAGSEAVASYELKSESIAKAKVSIADQGYTGRPVEIKNEDIISLKVSGESLTAGKDFVIVPTGYSNNINKGKAKVTLKGIGNYGGTATASFKIVQKDFRWREVPEDNQQIPLYTVTLQNTSVNEYVEKNGKLSFITDISIVPKAIPTAVKINGTEYPLIEDLNGKYKAEIPAGSVPGSLSLQVSGIKIGNEEYPVLWSKTIQVLKAAPTASNGVWTEKEDGKLEFTFDVADPDEALISGSRVVVTKEGQTVKESGLLPGENTISFEAEGGKTYHASIQLSYDLDSDHNNGKNQENQKQVYTSETTTAVTPVVPDPDTPSPDNPDPGNPDPDNPNPDNPDPDNPDPDNPNPDTPDPENPSGNELLELKEITSVRLYYQGKELQGLDITQGVPENPQDYMVKIESKRARDLFVRVEDFVKEGSRLRVIPMLSGFMHYEEENGQIVEKDNILLYADNVTSGITSIQQLLEDMNNDLQGSYELTQDLDASGITTEFGVMGSFLGTLKGNGYTIYNLNKPLFESLEGIVEGVRIENANIKGQNSILAKEANGADIKDTHIINSVIDSPDIDMVGAFVGNMKWAYVTNCTVENIQIKAAHTIGGVAGQTDNVRITNVVVSGRLTGTDITNQGTEIGGIAGRYLSNGRINNCYTQVIIQGPAQAGSGGIFGGPSNGTAGRIESSLAHTQGVAYGIAGFDDSLGTDSLETVTKVYQMTGEQTAKNSKSGITDVQEITDSLLSGLGISDKAWELYNESLNETTYMDALSRIEGFDSSKTLAYENLSKLAYAKNSKELVQEANALTDTDLLQKRIKHIYPVDESGKNIIGLIQKEEASLTKLLLEFEDGSQKEIPVTYAFTADGLVAVYKSQSPAITYHYDKFVSQVDQAVKTELLDQVKAYGYEADLDPITAMEDRRQYKDYYNETTVNNLEEFITLQMISMEDFPFYVEDADFKTQIKERLKEDLPELLYAYNYVNKWYDFTIGNINAADLLYFDSERLAENLTQEILVQSIVDGDCSDTQQTLSFFKKFIQPRTGKDLYEVVENLVMMAGYSSANDWMKESFKGILREQNVLGTKDPSGIRYRAFDNLKTLQGEKSLLLPILTGPQEDMILVSVPSQLLLGSINRYYKEDTPQTRAAMEANVDTFCQWTGNYFGSIVNIVPNAKTALNNKMIVNYDSVLDYYDREQYPGKELEGVSEEPVFKWVNEAVRKWASGSAADSAAYTTGEEVFFSNVPIFGGELGFRTFTHENAHTQDASLFYLGNARRGSNPEYHADGVLAQEFNNGTMTFNLSRTLDHKEDVVVNLSPERVNSLEKLEDYYKDMFDASYVLDYLIGKAFLKLEPAAQSKLAVRAVEYAGVNMGLAYVKASESEITNMQLNTIADLIENKLALREADNEVGNYGYYVESFWNTQWYQPHNGNGISDEASFKRMAHELLGYAGYENGFVTWLSAKSKNDADALRQITNNSFMTFDQYKNNRFNEVELKLASIPWFDAQEVIGQFEETLRNDATRGIPSYTNLLKKVYYQSLKRATNDFTDGNIYQLPTVEEVQTAQELVNILESNKPVYVKLANHIDLSLLPYTNGYYFESFSGIFDGNGYEIYGQKAPLFNEIVFGGFKNMYFDAASIGQAGGGGILSNHVKHIVINGIKYDKSLNLPLITNTAPIGYAYNIYNEPGVGEVYDSPRN